MKSFYTILVTVLLFSFVFTGCSTTSPQPSIPTSSSQNNQPETAATAEQAYPLPLTSTGNLANPAYPSPTQLDNSNSAYPGPQPTINKGTEVKPVPFLFTRPIQVGATQVSGTGPADIPISLVDITLNGEVLGTTTIKSDGTFSFETKPLEADHWIGVALSNLEGTPWVLRQF